MIATWIVNTFGHPEKIWSVESILGISCSKRPFTSCKYLSTCNPIYRMYNAIYDELYLINGHNCAILYMFGIQCSVFNAPSCLIELIILVQHGPKPAKVANKASPIQRWSFYWIGLRENVQKAPYNHIYIYIVPFDLNVTVKKQRWFLGGFPVSSFKPIHWQCWSFDYST